ncbi:MAG: CehA/McbA family metallohydrolase [Albidovulum sp.]|nr:CehA/McbA family metallohydrolase [Albidovulum sp.]
MNHITQTDKKNGRIFEGVLTLNDFARHVPHEIDVPEGVAVLRVHFEYDSNSPPAGGVSHQLSISVYDPAGARGTRHNNNDQSVVLSADYASPGYLPGPIAGGRWVVEIDAHRILAPGLIRYRIAAEWGADSPDSPAPAIAGIGARKRSGPGWFRGDLHGHSLHSDACWSVERFGVDAQRRGLDFAFLTDHNTISGLGDLPALNQGRTHIFAGVELTTFFGHALVLGTDRHIDWRIKDGETMAARVAEIQADGMLFVIAHPRRTDCPWQYPDVYPGPATHVEVWNRAWRIPYNEHALQLYYGWLGRGYKLFATCGSDTHGPNGRDQTGYNIVFAHALTQREILTAMKKGRSYLSSGPELGVEAHTETGEKFGMGQSVPSPITSVSIRTRRAPPGSTLRLLSASPGNAGVRLAHEVRLNADANFEFDQADFTWNTFLIVEIRDADRRLCALSNPIFLSHESQDQE